MQRGGHDPLDGTAAGAEALLGTLRLACGLVRSGRAVELAGLDDQVGRLCARVLDLPTEQARGLRPALIRVAQAADELTRSLQARPPPA